jgi:ABC-type glycerol-3-phosphate transport system substrate-binding protein
MLLTLIAISVARGIWLGRDTSGKRTPLVWVTGSNPARQEQIAAFNQENPDVELVLDISNTGVQKTILQCSSGVGPDIFEVNDGEQLQTFVQAGIPWDITEAAGAGGFSASRDLWPAALPEVTYEGRQYSYSCSLNVNLLLYNKNIFDHCKVPYPEGSLTWDQFLEISQKLRAGSNGKVHAITGLNWQIFFESQGGQYFAEDGRLTIANSSELRRALEMHRDFVFKYKIMPTALELSAMSGQGGWGAGSLNQFASGKFGMIVSGQWAIVGLARTLDKQKKLLATEGDGQAAATDPLRAPLRLGSVLLPRFVERDHCFRANSRSAAINAASPRREQALAFLKYLSSPSYCAQINQAADGLAPNPAYAELGIQAGPPELARLELHENTKRAADYAYTQRRSPYLATVEVLTALRKQVSRLENDPTLPIDHLLEAAQRELEALLQRNLSRHPDLRKQYDIQATQTAIAVPVDTP